MPDSISTIVNSFSKFLTEKKTNLKNNPNNFLISYCLPLDKNIFEFEMHSLAAKFSKSFYFEIPAEHFAFTAIDEVISISEKGEGRFAATEKKVNEWKENFINNWETIKSKRIPLFIGSLKFMVEHSDEDWKEFEDSDWFVPEFLFLQVEKENFLLYNLIFSGNSSTQKSVEKFQLKIDNLFKVIKEYKPEVKDFSVISESGSTPKDKKKWKQLIGKSLDEIQDGKIEKIVLSRKVEYLLSEEPDIEQLILQLKERFPHCYIFIVNHNKSIFFGATPERLANFVDGKIEIEALAGSAPRGKDEKEDKVFENNLLKSDKDLREHNFVVNHIKQMIKNYSADEIEIVSPSIRKLANIQHLLTKFSLNLVNGTSILSVVKGLSPTPAVCGIPAIESLHLIKKLENHNRGLYGGLIGWLNFENEGEFAVAIRSAILNRRKLLLMQVVVLFKIQTRTLSTLKPN